MTKAQAAEQELRTAHEDLRIAKLRMATLPHIGTTTSEWSFARSALVLARCRWDLALHDMANANNPTTDTPNANDAQGKAPDTPPVTYNLGRSYAKQLAHNLPQRIVCEIICTNPETLCEWPETATEEQAEPNRHHGFFTSFEAAHREMAIMVAEDAASPRAPDDKTPLPRYQVWRANHDQVVARLIIA